MNLLALVLTRILEGETGNARRRLFGDDLQTLNDARNDLVLDPRIETLGVLAEDDEVNIRITRRNVRQVPDRPEICEQLELLPQLYVDA